jgi:membrane-anchored protein YejM (alkaline phosphatase superfamily)
MTDVYGFGKLTSLISLLRHFSIVSFHDTYFCTTPVVMKYYVSYYLSWIKAMLGILLYARSPVPSAPKSIVLVS